MSSYMREENPAKQSGQAPSQVDTMESMQQLCISLSSTLQELVQKQIMLERYLGISISKGSDYVIYKGGIANYLGDLIIKEAPARKKWYQFWRNL